MNEAIWSLSTTNIGLDIGLYLRVRGDYYGYRSSCRGDRTGKGVCLCKQETHVEDSSRTIVKLNPWKSLTLQWSVQANPFPLPSAHIQMYQTRRILLRSPCPHFYNPLNDDPKAQTSASGKSCSYDATHSNNSAICIHSSPTNTRMVCFPKFGSLKPPI